MIYILAYTCGKISRKLDSWEDPWDNFCTNGAACVRLYGIGKCLKILTHMYVCLVQYTVRSKPNTWNLLFRKCTSLLVLNIILLIWWKKTRCFPLPLCGPLDSLLHNYITFSFRLDRMLRHMKLELVTFLESEWNIHQQNIFVVLRSLIAMGEFLCIRGGGCYTQDNLLVETDERLEYVGYAFFSLNAFTGIIK